jgi:hypothetical protein
MSSTTILIQPDERLIFYPDGQHFYRCPSGESICGQSDQNIAAEAYACSAYNSTTVQKEMTERYYPIAEVISCEEWMAIYRSEMNTTAI